MLIMFNLTLTVAELSVHICLSVCLSILFRTHVETSLQPNVMLIIFNCTDCHWVVCLSVCSSGHRHSSWWGLQCERLSGVPELWGGGCAHTCPHLEEGEFFCHHSDTQQLVTYFKMSFHVKCEERRRNLPHFLSASFTSSMISNEYYLQNLQQDSK